jgi:hypothetical protein
MDKSRIDSDYKTTNDKLLLALSDRMMAVMAMAITCDKRTDAPNQIQDSTHLLSCVEYTCMSRPRRVQHLIVLAMARF